MGGRGGGGVCGEGGGGGRERRREESGGLTAADVLNGYDGRGLARVLRRWGEGRFARQIARAVVRDGIPERVGNAERGAGATLGSGGGAVRVGLPVNAPALIRC